MENKKKIVFVTSSAINGGAQKHIREMFVSMTDNGHEVFLVCPEGWLAEELNTYKRHIYTFVGYREGVGALSMLIDKEKPDITNTFILSGGVLGAIAWRKKRYGKLFVTVNNPVIYDGISCLRKIVYPRLYRWLCKYVSAFLVKSDAVGDEVSGTIRYKKPVISIKNGVDFRVFDKDAKYPDLRTQLGIPKEGIVITNVAVLNERKGQRHLIEAMAVLRRKYLAYAMIAGDGPIRKDLEDCAKQNRVDDIVHFLGRRKDVNSVLANSDIFVLSSYHEGLPNSLMEAMAMGLACVATDVGGVRQLIESQYDGIIIQPKSSEGIVNAVDWLIEHPRLMCEYGERAHKKMVGAYGQEAVTKELEEIYDKY